MAKINAGRAFSNVVREQRSMNVGRGGNAGNGGDGGSFPNVRHKVVAVTETTISILFYGLMKGASIVVNVDGVEETITVPSYQITGKTAGSNVAISYYQKLNNKKSPIRLFGVTMASTGAGEILDTHPDLVAFWDFSESQAPFTAKRGSVAAFPLSDGLATASAVTTAAVGPFGNSLVLDGTDDYLQIDIPDVGDLHLAQFGNNCTVVGWVRRSTLADGAFVAGIWREDDSAPKRQYGLFVDLPAYGGSDRVIGHVSKTGGATPGYAFSRDMSVSRQQVGVNDWVMVAFTYDGTYSRAYYNGILDPWEDYTDGEGNTSDSNPYFFDSGLNTDPGEFTVGAVQRISGIDNFFSGNIGGVAVFKGVLSQSELMQLHRETLMNDDAIISLSMSANSDGGAWEVGMKSAYTSTAIDSSKNLSVYNWATTNLSYIYISGATAGADYTSIPSVCYIDTLHSVTTTEVSEILFTLNNSNTTDEVKACIRIGTQWYVSVDGFSVTTGGTAADWSNAIDASIDLSAGLFDLLTIDVGVELSVATSGSVIPSGEITGVGVYVAGASGIVRVDNLKVK